MTENMQCKNVGAYIFVIFALAVFFVSCKSKAQNRVENDYWQTEPKLALAVEETFVEDAFHYEEVTLDDGSCAVKKVGNEAKLKLMKNEIVSYRLTSDDRVVIMDFDETYNTGFLDKRDFDVKFSVDLSEMQKFGDLAFVRSGTKIYDEDLNLIKTAEGLNSESIIVGRVLERGDEYTRVSFNPDGSWQVFVKNEDLKYDGTVHLYSFYRFIL